MMSDHSNQSEQKCSNQLIHENGEEFKICSYNDVSILFRVRDQYFNATKLFSDGGRDFRTFKKGDRWRKIINEHEKRVQNGVCAKMLGPIYEIKKGFSNDIRGQYVHPKLIHFVADWVSIDYAFKVADIMDLINKNNQLKNKVLEETIRELQEENEYLNKVIEKLDLTVGDMLL